MGQIRKRGATTECLSVSHAGSADSWICEQHPDPAHPACDCCVSSTIWPAC
jgi:hypothetical protein